MEKKKKAAKMGIILKFKAVSEMPNVPDCLKHELSEMASTVGWSKSLLGKPLFTTRNITKYYEFVNKKLAKQLTTVKKHFERGCQLLEESFISTDSVYVKEDDTMFCIKSVCAASLKKQNRWVTAALSKETADVEYSFCECTAGKTGTCSHAFALMKLFAKVLVELDMEGTFRVFGWTTVTEDGLGLLTDLG